MSLPKGAVKSEDDTPGRAFIMMHFEENERDPLLAKTRQLENKAGTKGAKCGGNVWEIRWPGCSAADNETCATFRRHSRRQGTEQSMQ